MATPVNNFFDPTGTKKIRDSFKRDFQKRWHVLVRLTTEAVTKNDLVGLSVQSIAHSSHSGCDVIKNFQRWFDNALQQIVLANNGSWMFGYFDQAQRLAFAHSESVVRLRPQPGSNRMENPLGSTPSSAVIRSTAVVELEGIIEAVSHQVVRAVSNGLLAKWRPAKIVRAIAERIRSIGRVRSEGLVDFMIVKMFNETTLDRLEGAGIKSVHLLPEFVRHSPPVALTDAVKKPRSFSKRSEVDVLTAGDKKVCLICQKIADNGPYEISKARGLIPAHINCRCAFAPAGDLPLFDPSQVPERNRPHV